jgi:copper chaperone CopZ
VWDILKFEKENFMDYYCNYLPGRIRIQTPFIHRNPQNAATLSNNLKCLEGITSVETDTLTGSALILFDENKIKHQQIISFLEKQSYFILSKANKSDEDNDHAIDYYYNYEPGRIRIQTPFIHGNQQNAATFVKTIQSLEGISSVETDTLTGSALILFDENKIKHQQIIGFLEKQGYFILSKAKTSDEVVEKAAEKVLEVAEKIVVDSAEDGMGEA